MSALYDDIIDMSGSELFTFLLSEFNALNNEIKALNSINENESLEINLTVDHTFDESLTPRLNITKIEQPQWIELFHFLDKHFSFYYRVPDLFVAALYDKNHSLGLRVQFFPFLANECTYVSFSFSRLNESSLYYDKVKAIQEKLHLEEKTQNQEQKVDKIQKI